MSSLKQNQFSTPTCKKRADLVRVSQEIHRRNQINVTQNVAAMIGTTVQNTLRVLNTTNSVASTLNRAILRAR